MSKTRQWATITAVVVLVILAGGYLLLVKSEKSKVADLKTQTESQLQQNQILLTQISSLQSLQKQLPAQQQALSKFSTLIPDSADEPTLVRQLSSAARGAGVDLKSIAPSGGTAVSTTAAPAPEALGAPSASVGAASLKLYSMTLSLSVSGSYANVESFFQSLERMPRAILVGNFSLSPSSDPVTGLTVISVTMTTKVFYTPTTAPTDNTGAAAPQSLTPTTAATTPVPGDTSAPGAAPTTAANTPASAT
jgi:Tfp pilus assembly protein PilO